MGLFLKTIFRHHVPEQLQ